MVSTINIALSGLNAATTQLNASASNIANLTTAGSLETGRQAPYTPLQTQNTARTDTNGNPQGVSSQITPRASDPFTPSFAPDSPFANAEGIIGIPNINLAEEAVNLQLAEIQYKANASVIKTAGELTDELLNLFDDQA